MSSIHVVPPESRFNKEHYFWWFERLFEDLAVSPLVSLTIDSDGLVPRPLIIDECPILSLAGVELGEFVAFPVWGNVKGREGLVTTDQECTLDGRIIGDSID